MPLSVRINVTRFPWRDRRLATIAVLAGLATACSDGPTSLPPEGAVDLAHPLVQVTPESVGLDGNALFLAGEVAGRVDRVRSLVVLREGRLAYERYYGGWTRDTLADVRSVTKSVVSTLAGIAIDQGRIRGLDQPITDFLRAPEFDVDFVHTLVTVRHLLMMTSGFYWAENNVAGYNDWITSADHIDYLLGRDFQSQPGTSFTYNSAAVHLLGVVIEKAVGMSLPEYADRVLFGPLGIAAREWEDLSPGYVNGGAGLDLRPRDLARFGQLYLQQGWSGESPIVPAAWIAEATTSRWASLGGVGPISDTSYGFLWWLDLDNDAFFAWGFGGQFVYVVPRLDLVVVATTDWRGVTQDIGSAALQEAVLDVIVNRVLPAVR